MTKITAPQLKALQSVAAGDPYAQDASITALFSAQRRGWLQLDRSAPRLFSAKSSARSAFVLTEAGRLQLRRTIELSRHWNGIITPNGAGKYQWALMGSHPATVYAKKFGLADTGEQAEALVRAAHALEPR